MGAREGEIMRSTAYAMFSVKINKINIVSIAPRISSFDHNSLVELFMMDARHLLRALENKMEDSRRKLQLEFQYSKGPG